MKITISPQQTLSEVASLWPLPSDAIFHKRIPGIGATHGEILAKRHSIIVLPNRPVIDSKVKKHNGDAKPNCKILGVHKRTTPESLLEYLNDDNITFKKILITPESYAGKLKLVVGEGWDIVKHNFYLLIDECERTIQDKDYRDKISAPFDDFFTFKSKGLISATTLPFSDPRFESLTHYYVLPDYVYRKPLSLVTTNNVVAAFRVHLKEKPSERYFIFLSSVKATIALIEAIGIQKESIIHCSESKARSVDIKKFNSSSSFDKDKLAKYNFFTSRFYSGLDMILDFMTDVLLITDVNFAEHSILDPQTEVIQIVGRFRKGVNSTTHITNFNHTIESKTQQQVQEYLAGQKDVYKQILEIKSSCKSQGGFDAIEQILTLSPFSRYFKEDGSYDWFMYDNFIQEQRVLGFYQSPEKLAEAYQLVNDHFEITVEDKRFPHSDADRMRRQSLQSKKAEIEEVTNQLQNMHPSYGKFTFYSEDMYNDLKTEYPNIVRAFNLIGAEGIKKADFTASKIQLAVNAKIEEQSLLTTEVIADVEAKFKGYKKIKEVEAIQYLSDIYKRHGITLKVKPKQLKLYFKTSSTTINIDNSKVHAINILSPIEH
ncbi:MAG: hypothetical protein WC615_11775 [Mucilaginibacter sp.]|uniref:hypothetical protein n=1 Tax=Mucilaginibacter sp. TaxID=1882438 RepID=UPI00356797BA